jgi:hypothetical protein
VILRSSLPLGRSHVTSIAVAILFPAWKRGVPELSLFPCGMERGKICLELWVVSDNETEYYDSSNTQTSYI